MDQKELRELEDKCVQEYPPACTTACPVHVDVRLFVTEIKKGNFDGALKILRKRIPFPGIIGRICDHPCQDACKRREAGDAIAIAALERACVQISSAPPAKITPPPQKDKRIAVVGGGLSGLTAAFDLAGKGYPVVIFELKGRLGGSLWNTPDEILPRQVIAAETAVLEQLGVEFRFNTTVGQDVSLPELRSGFDAVYLGLGKNPKDTFGLKLNEEGRPHVDPVTFGTSLEKVFAGGGMLVSSGYSPIGSLSGGRRAAISIDRYLQGVSLTSYRENEGSYQTRLYTCTEGLEPLSAVVAADPERGYGPDEAILEAGRCLMCQCLECVRACEYLANYGGYPKRYLREIYHNEVMVKGTHLANKMINSCSICGLCRVVCPNDLHMGQVCKNARESMVNRGKMPPSPHDFPLRDMQFSNSDKFALTRNEPGKTLSSFLFFPGCQLSASDPEYVEKAYFYLREKITGGVGLMLRCCGAPADWAGQRGLFSEGMREILRQWNELGKPRIIVACSSCYQVFKTSLPEAKTISLWEVYDQLGLPGGASEKNPGTVAVHDACSTRHEKQIHESVRRILKKLNYTVEELKHTGEKTECCGYGGLMCFADSELAYRVIDRRIGESDSDYLAYCAMCRDKLASRGKRTLHILDLIYGSHIGSLAVRKGPGYSQRHENRARLKNKMLREVWGEEVREVMGFEKVKLDLSDEVKEIMENRLILVEDVQKVVDYAERTGNKLLNQSNGRFLAYYRPVSVTYWVEYSLEGAAFKIHNAYSHRMQIAGDVKK